MTTWGNCFSPSVRSIVPLPGPPKVTLGGHSDACPGTLSSKTPVAPERLWHRSTWGRSESQLCPLDMGRQAAPPLWASVSSPDPGLQGVLRKALGTVPGTHTLSCTSAAIVRFRGGTASLAAGCGRACATVSSSVPQCGPWLHRGREARQRDKNHDDDRKRERSGGDRWGLSRTPGSSQSAWSPPRPSLRPP